MTKAAQTLDLKTQCDMLVSFANIEIDFVKHIDTQRERFNFSLIVIIGFIAASIGWDQQVSRLDTYQGIFLIVVGFVGVLQTLKFHSKKQLHYNRHRAYRNALDRFMTDIDLNGLRELGAERFDQADRFPAITRMGTHQLWTVVPVMAMLIGLFVIFYALLGSA